MISDQAPERFWLFRAVSVHNELGLLYRRNISSTRHTGQQAHPGRAAAAHGRLPAAAARRAVPGEVPQQLGEAGAADARQGNRDRLHHARSLPHLPPRPPYHGAGAEFLVPAHRSQSANLHRHSQREAGGIPESHRAGLPSNT